MDISRNKPFINEEKEERGNWRRKKEGEKGRERGRKKERERRGKVERERYREKGRKRKVMASISKNFFLLFCLMRFYDPLYNTYILSQLCFC